MALLRLPDMQVIDQFESCRVRHFCTKERTVGAASPRSVDAHRARTDFEPGFQTSSRRTTTPESRHRPAGTPGARVFSTFQEWLSQG